MEIRLLIHGDIIEINLKNKSFNNLDETIKILYNSGMNNYSFYEYVGMYKEKTEENVLEKENSVKKIITYIKK